MKPSVFSFSKPFVTTLMLQAAVIGIILYAAHGLLVNTQANLEARNIASGFGFLSLESGMPISNSLLPYSPADSYGFAFFIGIINTLYVAFFGIILATLIGILIGVARVSNNWLISKLAEIYVEVLRNIPLLLTLFFTYTIALAALPIPKKSLMPFEGFFLNNRGIYLPRPIPESGFLIVCLAVLIGIIAAFMIHWFAKRLHRETGRTIPSFTLGLIAMVAIPAIAWWLTRGPIAWEFAVLKGFNFQGGLVIRPEFSALMIGLVLYTAAFIGENVRSGIQSVDMGQINSSKALGLTTGLTMRKVILPQALRVIIPATTNDYTSLVKNSSLAVAIGYPDMVSIGGTIIGQNDQAIEIIAMWMGVYMTINLMVSMIMNWLNAKVQHIGR
ncbi:MAG: ABC transporter permease subunit [Desulfobacula sp.]|uniref:amino acid ABC transporter permease n=1 Tax=Desulfobacula sp. TaxID=2593537 RepID=UPI0025C2EC66|nr:ABC transporter permease subunit [Desulfobacula sp.]MCD4722806.1 ABC transporter permease subunit [Desulfobacula sp.]